MAPQDKTPRDPKDLAGLVHSLEAGVDAMSTEIVELQKRAALGAVAGLLGHEVNNILTPVLTYVRLARKPGASQDAIERALHEAESGVLRTTEIASAILALGRGGTLDQDRRANLRDVARQSAAALGRDLGRDQISCEIRIPDDLEAAIAPGSLQQVLVNLLQNARAAILANKLTPGRIALSAEPLGGSTWNTGRVEIVVEDSGPGISPADADKVFEPFVRCATATPGTGLGLTVCRELVSAAGGSIRVEPRTDEHGARFVLSLPQCAATTPKTDHRAA